MLGKLKDKLGQALRLSGDLPGLLLDAERIAHTFMRGVHGRRRTGQGETFWQFRDYQQGDAPRDIDWRQTAKREKTFVRQKEWEAAQSVWLWRDPSPSMDFSSHKGLRTKKDFAEIMLLSAAIVLLNGGEQVSLLGSGISPQTHARAATFLAEALTGQGELKTHESGVAGRGQVILISDFYGDAGALSAFCAEHTARGVSGVLLQVCDPAEEDLPFSGRVRFEEVTGGENAVIPAVESIRDTYQQKFLEHRAAVEAIARSAGWIFLSARTDEKPESVLLRLYDALSGGAA